MKIKATITEIRDVEVSTPELLRATQNDKNITAEGLLDILEYKIINNLTNKYCYLRGNKWFYMENNGGYGNYDKDTEILFRDANPNEIEMISELNVLRERITLSLKKECQLKLDL